MGGKLLGSNFMANERLLSVVLRIYLSIYLSIYLLRRIQPRKFGIQNHSALAIKRGKRHFFNPIFSDNFFVSFFPNVLVNFVLAFKNECRPIRETCPVLIFAVICGLIRKWIKENSDLKKSKM
jgi:Na+/H+-dicarboxylate symporter